jgi:hypothetical protein
MRLFTKCQVGTNVVAFDCSKELFQKKEVEAVWIEDVMMMRDNKEGAYSEFCDHVLLHVVGRDLWKRRAHTHDMSQIATVSDEAFGLLLLENGWETWKAMFAMEDDIPSPKYSVHGPGTKKFQGWREEGIERFNELYDDVEEDRNLDEGRFEKAFKEDKLKTRAGKKIKRKRASLGEPEKPAVRARIEAPKDELKTVRTKDAVKK